MLKYSLATEVKTKSIRAFKQAHNASFSMIDNFDNKYPESKVK